MIRLRPHHLLCMLTYAGRGYTPRFTLNLDDIIRRLGSGEEIEIVSGPDDICAPWLHEAETVSDIRTPHCHESRIAGRDDRATSDISKLLQRQITPSSRLRLTANLISHLRQAYQAETIRTGCDGCEWKSFCDSLSASGFADCKLVPRKIQQA